MSKEALFYSISGVLLICGFLLVKTGVKKTNPGEKINKTELKTDGKGGRIHFIYLGVTCIILALIILSKIRFS
jgi:phosphate starvation-inducible membrane PsiE